MLRFSEVTLRARQHLNMSGSDHLLFVALMGVVLFLSMYVMHNVYKFLRSKRSSNVQKYRSRNLQVKIWSRRKVFWRQMKISRSAYITLAQQRLVYNIETGDSHIPVRSVSSASGRGSQADDKCDRQHVGLVSSSSGQGTVTIISQMLDGSQSQGHSEPQPVGSVSSSSCQGTVTINHEVVDDSQADRQYDRQPVGSVSSSSVQGTVTIISHMLDESQEQGQSEPQSVGSVPSSSGQGTVTINHGVVDGSQTDGPRDYQPVGSVSSSSGQETETIISHMLDGSQEQGQSECQPVGSVSSSSAQGTVTINHDVLDGSQGDGQCEHLPVRSVSSASCQGTSLMRLKKLRSGSEQRLPYLSSFRRKSVKKRIGFRRRTGGNTRISAFESTGNSHHVNIPRRISKKKRKKKIRLSQQGGKKQLSPPLVREDFSPKYHLSFDRVLQAYKSIRKGRCFHASKRVIWRNRYNLIRGNRDCYKIFERNQEKEYDVPEPPEEQEDPHMHQIGKEHPSNKGGDGPVKSDNSGDGPVSSALRDGLVCDGEYHAFTGGLLCGFNQRSSTITCVTKSIKENAGPQWILTGPQYSSDYAGDGPHSSEEYDPEKDKAIQKKRKNAKAKRR